jgi:hypothetical protein
MRTVQMSSRETEPDPPQPTFNLEQSYEWFVRAFIVCYIIGVCYALLRKDETRLHVLHLGIRSLQWIARYAGFWALQTEQAYYDTANTLHS